MVEDEVSHMRLLKLYQQIAVDEKWMSKTYVSYDMERYG